MSVRLCASLCALVSLAATASVASTPPILQIEEEVRGIPLRIAAATEDEEILRVAAAAVRRALAATAGGEGPVARLNSAAGEGPQPVTREVAALVERAIRFCRWSENRFGPVAGRLHALWSPDGGRFGARPSAPERRQAVESARCDGVTVGADGESVALAEDVVIDLRGFALGFAVDRATEGLVRDGVPEARIALGGVQRAFGAGPSGEGWPLAIDIDASVARYLGDPRLRDGAIAVVTGDRGLVGGEGDSVRLVDHTTGLPIQGVRAVAASSELAVDAEALATTLFVTGNRLGSFLLGRLRPTPSALWLLGRDEGRPLVADFRWSRVAHSAGSR